MLIQTNIFNKANFSPARTARQNSPQVLWRKLRLTLWWTLCLEKGRKKCEKSVKNVASTNKLSFSDWIVNFRKKFKRNLW